MNALVTGGAGFIGSHLVEALIARGDQVRVLDNLSSGTRDNLPPGDCELVEADIRDERAAIEAMRGVDCVFHLAAMISVAGSIEDPWTCYDVNLMGSLKVLRAARDAGVRRVVLSSSAAVYGNVEGPVSEARDAQPMAPYSGSKWAMEGAGQIFHATYDLPTVSLRYFNVYGPRQSPHSDYAAVIPAFIEAMLAGRPPVIHGDGRQTRDFVYVGDVVRANLLAAEGEAAGGVFNIGSGTATSVRDLAGVLQRFVEGAVDVEYGPERPGDIRDSQADISRAKRALGYRAEVTFEEGLEATVEWFRSVRREGAGR